MSPSSWRGPAAAGLAWLLLPSVLFWAGWWRPGPAALLLGLLGLAAGLAVRGRPQALPQGRAAWLSAGLWALCMLWLAGFPQGPYAWDWFKHWALLQELADRPWPLRTVVHDEALHLRYYVGAYLVPAGLHHLLPALPLWLATAAWWGLGWWLVGLGAVAVVGRWWAPWALTLTVGGADLWAAWGLRALLGWSADPLAVWGGHPDNWAGRLLGLPLEFNTLVTMAGWVPHQAIATALVACLALWPGAGRPRLLLAAAVLGLFSPYGLIGLVPLLVWRCLAEGRADRATWGAGGFALLCVGLTAWHLGHELPPQAQAAPDLVARLSDARYLRFLLVELLPVALLLGRRAWQDPACRVSWLTLVALPYLHGSTADLVMRGSTGPLLVLGLRALQGRPAAAWPAAVGRRWALALVLVLPGVLAEAVYLRSGGAFERRLPADDPVFHPPLPATDGRVRTLEQFLDACGRQYRAQYLTRLPAPLLRPAASAASAP